MLRVRDADAIGSVGTYQKEQADALEVAFEKLKKDVNDILINYNGAGAQTSVASFLNGIDNYKKVIEKIRQYGNYQESIFKHDSENVSKASKTVNTLINEPITNVQPITETSVDYVENDISNQTLKLNDIVTGGDYNA